MSVMTRKDLKAKAKSALQGHRFLCVLAFALLTALLVVCGFLPGALLVFQGPLLYSGAVLFLRRMRGEEGTLATLLEGFLHFPSSFGSGFLMLLLILLWAAIGVVPGALFCAASTSYAPSYLIAAVGVLMCAGGLYLGVFRFLQYSQTFYLLHDDADLGVLSAMRLSKELMQGRKIEFLMLYLSFIPWYLTVLFSAGLSLLFVGPYVALTCAGYYDLLRTEPLGTPALQDTPRNPPT